MWSRALVSCPTPNCYFGWAETEEVKKSSGISARNHRNRYSCLEREVGNGVIEVHVKIIFDFGRKSN